MKSEDIARRRLSNQHIARPTFERPSDVVRWLGAVQAQDYLGSLWAVGLRMRRAVEADVERALTRKSIIRTWPMRGTLHFVAAEDVRWMLRLLTPRIVAGAAARRHQQLGLDEPTFTRSKELFSRALQGGKQSTRGALYHLLEGAHISTDGGRGLHILSRLAQDGLICFGAREGKQHTFALLEEWAPRAKTLPRDEALAELARRYFTSHGPATLQDFAWWTGLRTSDARGGLEMVKSRLTQEVIAGRPYWFSASGRVAKEAAPAAHLLPVYDEYTVAYRDRSAVLDPSSMEGANHGNGIFNPTVVIDGQVVGTWKRRLGKDKVVITPGRLTELSRAGRDALAAAARRYGEFLGVAVDWPG